MPAPEMTLATPADALVSPGTGRRLWLLVALGGAALVYDLLVGTGVRAWQSLLINFLFFAGLAQAGIVWSALLHATSARWGRSLKRLAEATAAFFPVSLLMLLVLLGGVAAWAPWVQHPVADKALWLNVPFFVARQLAAFLVLTGLSVWYLYHSLRPDLGLLRESGHARNTRMTSRLLAGWRGRDAEQRIGQQAQDRLAVAVLIAYGWVFTLVAFDFVMALDPHWYSTLFGGYYFVGNLFIGLAFLSIVAATAARRLGIAAFVGRQQLHDIGKLLFGFSVLWAYMFWSQYFVIWYGDLAEETAFIRHRLHGSWTLVAWTVLATCFVVPFVVLLSRAIKRHAAGLTAIAAVALAGMWLERFILVSPSLWSAPTVPLGVVELLVTGGVGSLFLLCYSRFLAIVPALPVSDPRLAPVSSHDALH